MKRIVCVFVLFLLCMLPVCVTAAADTPADTEGVISYIGLSARTRTDYVGLRSLYSADHARISDLEAAGHRVTYGALMGVGYENEDAVLSVEDMTVKIEGDRIVAYGAGTRDYRTAAVVVYDTDDGYGASGVYVSDSTPQRTFAFTTIYTAKSENKEKLKGTELVYRAFLIVDGNVTYVDAVGDVFGGDTGYGTATSLYELSSYFASRDAGDADAGYQNHTNIRKVISLCMNTAASFASEDAPVQIGELADMRAGIYAVTANAAIESIMVNGVITFTENYDVIYTVLPEGNSDFTIISEASSLNFSLVVPFPIEDTVVLSEESGSITVPADGLYTLYAVGFFENVFAVTIGDFSASTGFGGINSEAGIALSAGEYDYRIYENGNGYIPTVYLVRESHTVSMSNAEGDILSNQKVYTGDSAVIPSLYFEDLLYFDGCTEGVTEDLFLTPFFRSQFDYKLVGNTAMLTAYTGDHYRLILPDTLDGYTVTAIGKEALTSADRASYLYIPDSVTVLESGALAACTAVDAFMVGEENTAFTTKNGDLYSKDGKTLVRAAIGATGTMIEIEDGVTALADYALAGASARSVLLPESVTAIGRHAFSDMKRLVAVYYAGASAAWSRVSLENGNGIINTSTLYYYSATKPATGDENNYWYYKNGSIAVYQNSSWTPPVA